MFCLLKCFFPNGNAKCLIREKDEVKAVRHHYLKVLKKRMAALKQVLNDFVIFFCEEMHYTNPVIIIIYLYMLAYVHACVCVRKRQNVCVMRSYQNFLKNVTRQWTCSYNILLW